MDPDTSKLGASRMLFRLAAIACLVTAGGLGWCAAQQVNLTWDLRAGLDEVTRRAEVSERDAVRARDAVEDARARVTVLAAPDVRPVTLEAQPGAGDASGRAFWSATQGVVITASRIPPTPAGHVYQLWFVIPPNPVSVGLLTVDDDGRVFETIAVSDEASLPVAIAITVEPTGGADRPTGDVLLLGRTDR